MGRVRDICLVPNLNTIYVLARMTNKRLKLRYHLSKFKYDTDEEIARNIASNVVSMFIYICVMHYCKDHSILYKLLIIDILFCFIGFC